MYEERAEIEVALAAAPAELGLARELRDLNEAIRARYADRLSEPLPPAMLKLLARVPAR